MIGPILLRVGRSRVSLPVSAIFFGENQWIPMRFPLNQPNVPVVFFIFYPNTNPAFLKPAFRSLRTLWIAGVQRRKFFLNLSGNKNLVGPTLATWQSHRQLGWSNLFLVCLGPLGSKAGVVKTTFRSGTKQDRIGWTLKIVRQPMKSGVKWLTQWKKDGLNILYP